MPIFYEPEIVNDVNHLNEEESRHCSQVLRHQPGDLIRITDGKGGIYQAILTEVSKKKCYFEIKEQSTATPKASRIHLAIAPTKNTDRMEWLIEKLCEIGIDEVTFILTKHSERKKLRLDRLERKTISALKQSGNPFKTIVNELVTFENFLQNVTEPQRFIAHVDDKHTHLTDVAKVQKDTLVLIGPEGDFSTEELNNALKHDFVPVGLGSNTLRTETAGFTACCYIHMMNKY